MLFVLDWTLKASLLLAVAGAFDVIFRRRSAALRHLTWTMALAGGLAVPLVSPLVPSWRLPIPARIGLPTPPAAGVRASTPPPLSEVAPPSPRVVNPPFAGRGSGTDHPAALDRPTGPATEGFPDAVRFRISVPWTSVVLPLWASGTLVLLVFMVLATARTRRLARRLPRLRSETIAGLTRRLARHIGLRREVILLEGDPEVMPMTWGVVRPVILLPADAAGWPATRLRSVLLHELGHVKRHDCLTQLVARVACALYWVNPLVWLAAARLRVERELACDDLVLATGSRPSEYAGHLIDVARTLRAERLASVAAIAMARPSHLGRRVTAVLDAGREHGVARAGLVATTGLAAAVLVLPLTGVSVWRDTGTAEGTTVSGTATARLERPVEDAAATSQMAVAGPTEPHSPLAAMRAEVRDLGQRPARLIANVRGLASAAWNSLSSQPAGLSVASVQSCSWTTDRNTSASTSINDDAMTIRIRVGDCRLEIQSEGEVEFTDDDADVARISRGGYFDIEERQGRDTQRLEVRARNGGLERRWLVNGQEQPYDAAARAWLAEMLPTVFRRTGLDAERRAERIFQRGGVDSVLQEIALIRSDWASRKYYTVLLARADLDAATLRRIVQQAGRDIASDFELAELLIAIAKQQTVDEGVRIAFVEATGHIESSFERRRALTAVLNREGLSAELADAMLQQSVGIESDFEAAELLIQVVRARPAGAVLPQAFWQSVNGIGSSFERRRVLGAVVARAAGNQAVLEHVLESGAGVTSDFERAELLIAVAGQYPANQALPAVYLRAVGTMSSGFELRRALDALVKRPGVSSAMLVSVLQAARGMRGDFERAELLVNIAKGYPLTPATGEAFFAAAAEIRGDFEHGRVLKAVIAQGDLDTANVRALLTSAAGIGSDFEITEILVAVARAYPIGDDLRPAFLKAADNIGSEYERGRVLSAMYRRGTRTDA